MSQEGHKGFFSSHARRDYMFNQAQCLKTEREMELIYRQATEADYSDILQLQHTNHFVNLSVEEKKNGFLTVEFTAEQFDAMNKDLAVIVAIQSGKLVGFMCGASWQYSLQFPLLHATMQASAEITLANEHLTAANAFFYGPVCIDSTARGKDLLKGLFQHLCEIAMHRYKFFITVISKQNPHSFYAHTKKLQMKHLGAFEFNSVHFYILGNELIETQKSRVDSSSPSYES